MAKPLHERLASARSTDRVSIADLEVIIADAVIERDRLSSIAAQAAGDATNYALTSDDRDDADARAARAKRDAAALALAIDELTTKLDTRRASAAQKAKADELAAVIAERDALADRLANEWPEIESRMVALLTAVQASDARLQAAGLHDPSAEAIARGCPGNFHSVAGPIRRLTAIMLPNFRDGARLAWPEAKPNPLALSTEAARAMRLRMQADREAENARWSRYHVTPPADRNIAIETRRGPAFLSRKAVTVEMTAEGVQDARKSGCTVEVAAPGEVIGAPAGVVSF